MSGPQKQPDLRWAAIRGLWQLADACHAAQEKQFAARVKAVVCVALHDQTELRSPHQLEDVAEVGDVIADALRATEFVEGRERATRAVGDLDRVPARLRPPPFGRYASAAEAALVALFEFEGSADEAAARRANPTHPSLLRYDALVERATPLLEPGRTFRGSRAAEHQVRVLKNRVDARDPLLYQRTRHHDPWYFELTPRGREVARRLRAVARRDAAAVARAFWAPLARATELELDASTRARLRAAREPTLLVDFREGGGTARSLAPLVAALRRERVPFEVRTRARARALLPTAAGAALSE